jgi:hypothetical protein
VGVLFLSGEWFAEARERLCGSGAVSPGANARIQYSVGSFAGGTIWHEVVEDGQVAVWERGELADADVELRWSVDDAFEILSGKRTGADAVAATTMVEQRPPGSYIGPLPPLDLFAEPEIGRLSRLDGADLTLHYDFAGPFGCGLGAMIFTDGRLEQMVAGWVGDADVVVEFPFRQLMLFWRGETGWADALQHGRIRGSIDGMVFLAGIIESVPYQRATRSASAGPAPLALATLGEVMTSEGGSTALAELMTATHRGHDN